MAPKTKKQNTTVFDDLITKAPKITVLSDNPVSLADMKSDIFNFRYHLGPVYDIIRHEKTRMPLTIGINGKWGTGKTTAMKWLYDILERWEETTPKSENKVTKSKPENIAKRVARNKARREAIRKGRVSVGDGKELDHIKPIILFNFNSPEDKEFQECWALNNLRPLEKMANIKKGNKYEENLDETPPVPAPLLLK